ncbi:cupredoxin domain-containing protein [Lactobacillaceae bacterium 24-114]
MAQLIVVIIAIVLIAGIIWWFFGNHSQEVGHAKDSGQEQTATVVVHGGYSPDKVVLKEGIPATINFDMKDSTACLSHVVFDSLGIDKDLTKQPVISVKIPTDKPGEYDFACGMGMFHGKVVVEK